MSVCLESWDIIDKDAHVIRVIHVYIVPWRPISGMICSPNWGLHPPKCQWPTIGPMESLGPSELQFKGIQNSAWFLCEVPFTQPRWFPGVHHLLLIINQYSIYHPDSWPTGFQKKDRDSQVGTSSSPLRSLIFFQTPEVFDLCRGLYQVTSVLQLAE